MLIIATTAHILQQNASRQVRNLADRSVVGLAELVEHSQITLRTIGSSPELTDYRRAVAGGDRQRIAATLPRLEHAFLGWQRLDSIIQAIRLIDPPGNVLVKVKESKTNWAVGPLHPPFNLPAVHYVGNRDFFRSALQLPRDGILISNLGHLINRVIAEQEGSAFLVERNTLDPGRNGIYLFHRDESCEFGDQTGSRRTIFDDYPHEITAAWLNSDHGIASDPRTRDILAHAYYSPYNRPDRGWVVVVNAWRDFFLEPLATIGRLTALWAVVVLLLASVVSIIFARWHCCSNRRHQKCSYSWMLTSYVRYSSTSF